MVVVRRLWDSGQLLFIPTATLTWRWIFWMRPWTNSWKMAKCLRLKIHWNDEYVQTAIILICYHGQSYTTICLFLLYFLPIIRYLNLLTIQRSNAVKGGYAILHFRNFSPYFRKSTNRNWLFPLSARVLNKYTIRIPQKRWLIYRTPKGQFPLSAKPQWSPQLRLEVTNR